MEIKDLISSGIIEMYCMGLASEEEIKQVEELASQHKSVRDEITSVYETLNRYAQASSKNPGDALKNKIINYILNEESKNGSNNLHFPPRLTLHSSTSEWFQYISDNNIDLPENFDMVFLLDLPGNEKQTTYIACAKKGAVVEEAHDEEDEYLLMLKGNCSVTINGKIGYYKEGDIVYVPARSLHCAEALSDETMILVGQRIAA